MYIKQDATITDMAITIATAISLLGNMTSSSLHSFRSQKFVIHSLFLSQ